MALSTPTATKHPNQDLRHAPICPASANRCNATQCISSRNGRRWPHFKHQKSQTQLQNTPQRVIGYHPTQVSADLPLPLVPPHNKHAPASFPRTPIKPWLRSCNRSHIMTDRQIKIRSDPGGCSQGLDLLHGAVPDEVGPAAGHQVGQGHGIGAGTKGYLQC